MVMSKGYNVVRCARRGCDNDISEQTQYGSKDGWICEDCQVKKDKDEQHRFFFWYKKENKQWIKNTLSKVGRSDLLKILLPENNTWKKNKGDKAKNTFDETVVFKPKGKKKHKEYKSVLNKPVKKR